MSRLPTVLTEFGVVIVGEDNRTEIHYKVAALHNTNNTSAPNSQKSVHIPTVYFHVRRLWLCSGQQRRLVHFCAGLELGGSKSQCPDGMGWM